MAHYQPPIDYRLGRPTRRPLGRFRQAGLDRGALFP